MATRTEADRVCSYSDLLPKRALIHQPYEDEGLLSVPHRVDDSGQMYVETNVHLCVKDVASFREGKEVNSYYMGAPYPSAVGKMDDWSSHLKRCEACQAAQDIQKDTEMDWLKEVSG